MKLKTSVQWNREGEEPGYLLDARTGSIHALNPTAALLLEELQAGARVDGLEGSLRERFDVAELPARMDVAAFLRLLLENDLVEH